MRRVEGENWRERFVGKAAGDERVFIPGRRSGCQMKPAQAPYRRRRAGEGGHGAAKPNGVIHRCRVNQHVKPVKNSARTLRAPPLGG
jgi:hypothetical protein